MLCRLGRQPIKNLAPPQELSEESDGERDTAEERSMCEPAINREELPGGGGGDDDDTLNMPSARETNQFKSMWGGKEPCCLFCSATGKKEKHSRYTFI